MARVAEGTAAPNAAASAAMTPTERFAARKRQRTQAATAIQARARGVSLRKEEFKRMQRLLVEASEPPPPPPGCV